MNCCAFGCSNSVKKDKSIKFFRFPWNEERREQWTNAVNRKNFKPSDSSRLCDRHFISRRPSNCPEHPDYIPSIFSFSQTTGRAEAALQRFQRIQQRRGINLSTATTSSQWPSTATSTAVEASSSPCESHGLTHNTADYDAAAALIELSDSTISAAPAQCSTTLHKVHSTTAISVQTTPKKYLARSSQASTPKHSLLNQRVNRLLRENASLKRILAANHSRQDSDLKFLKRVVNIENLSQNDVLLKYYTGIPSYAIYVVLCQHLQRLTVGINIKALGLKDCLLMILIKVRRNIGQKMISHLFGVSKSTVKKIFTLVTPCLAKLLSTLIIDPCAASVAKHLPKSFKKSRLFRKTRFIIDCTEIYIQRPKSLTARAQTYSNYKGRNTVKILVACTPTGGVAFISKAWGGRTSDIELVRRSGFYDLVQPGDHILADRGFRIGEDLIAKGATLSIPAFTRGRKQLEGRNVERSADISRVRIHIERCIGRMKTFKILSETIPITLLPQVDNFITIVGGICNLQQPLVNRKSQK